MVFKKAKKGLKKINKKKLSNGPVFRRFRKAENWQKGVHLLKKHCKRGIFGSWFVKRIEVPAKTTQNLRGKRDWMLENGLYLLNPNTAYKVFLAL